MDTQPGVLSRLAGLLERLLAVTAGLLFTALFLIIVLNITLRNLGGVALLWIPAAIRLLFIWTVFLGTAVLYARNDHLLMDFFVARLQPAARRRLSLLIDGVFLLFDLLLIRYGFLVVRVRMGIPFETWPLATGWAYLAVPVAGILMAVFALNHLSGRISKRRSS